uniref:Transmembrane protein n=1 Tax=Octopus bimaculoides TaxID=37653 RepID=A0A0L8FQ05_OCTBM
MRMTPQINTTSSGNVLYTFYLAIILAMQILTKMRMIYYCTSLLFHYQKKVNQINHIKQQEINLLSLEKMNNNQLKTVRIL